MRTVGAVVAAVALLLVVLAPPVLFGQSLGATGLVLTGAGVLGAGLLLRWTGSTRMVGTALAIVGALTLVVGIGYAALVFMGWGRGY